MSTREIYEIGEVPPVGHIPKQMYAQVIRAERFGEPSRAFKSKRFRCPSCAPMRRWST